MQLRPTELVLQDSSIYRGLSPIWQEGSFHGEIVFTTGMTGYCESLTDPSYAGQILAFTYPLIGNYGVPSKEEWESNRIYARGVIISEACLHHSHRSSVQSLLEWLADQQIPVIIGVDTRQLTIALRSHGVMLGAIFCSGERPLTFNDPNQEKLVAQVSIKKRQMILENNNSKTIVVVDCGLKQNIIRSLLDFPLNLHQVPFDADYSGEDFDGVFLSNGPGDPEVCEKTIQVLKRAMKKEKPIYGICLGAQILALAAGAKTYKLPFGHRGQNQPCIDTFSKRCYITSQNHGYAIDAESLPRDWEVTFTNLNDGSVEGIRHKHLPFSAVQFHPEACPGPTDTQWFFNQFYQSLIHVDSRV